MRAVLLLGEKTGWAEAEILALPMTRFTFYLRELAKRNE